MTSTTINLPEVSQAENDTVNRLLAELDAKAPRNLLRASFYDGKHAAAAVGSIIPPQYWKIGVVLGWTGKAVDFLARRCNLDDIVWPDGDLGSLGHRETWEGNHFDTEVSSAIVSSLLHGPSFLVNTAGDVRNGEPAGMIHVRDALSATGTWDPRARRLRDFLSVADRDAEGVKALNLYVNNAVIVARRDVTSRGGWAVQRVEHRWGVPAEPLVYKPRVGRPFGSSRISRPLMSTQDSALRTLVRLEAHDDVYTIPDLWLFGAAESLFRDANGARNTSWQALLGRIKAVPDDEDAADPALARADMKHVPASSPEPHLASLNAKAKLFAREASLPDTAVAITDMANPTSGEAYDASQHELIAEAEGAMRDWSPGIRRAYTRALAMKNGERSIPESWATIDLKVRDPRFLSKAAQADAGLKQLSAVPWLAETEVGLELLGLDSGQIKRALGERTKATGRETLEAVRALRAPAPAAPDADAAAPGAPDAVGA